MGSFGSGPTSQAPELIYAKIGIALESILQDQFWKSTQPGIEGGREHKNQCSATFPSVAWITYIAHQRSVGGTLVIPFSETYGPVEKTMESKPAP